MQTQDNGNAAENGEQTTEMMDNGQHSTAPNSDNRENGQAVPYSRFQEVNAKRKAAEETLASIVDELCGEVPENMRSLIPNLSPAEKVQWLRDARNKGLFNPPAPAASPDSKRPTAKTSDDYSNLSPIAMMAHGYNLR